MHERRTLSEARKGSSAKGQKFGQQQQATLVLLGQASLKESRGQIRWAGRRLFQSLLARFNLSRSAAAVLAASFELDQGCLKPYKPSKVYSQLLAFLFASAVITNYTTHTRRVFARGVATTS